MLVTYILGGGGGGIYEQENVYNVPIQRVVALYDYAAQGPEELTLHDGDIITLIAKEDDEWWQGKLNEDTGEQRLKCLCSPCFCVGCRYVPGILCRRIASTLMVTIISQNTHKNINKL